MNKADLLPFEAEQPVPDQRVVEREIETPPARDDRSQPENTYTNRARTCGNREHLSEATSVEQPSYQPRDQNLQRASGRGRQGTKASSK